MLLSMSETDQIVGTTDFWFRKLFRLRIHEVAGDSFQQLFSDVMTYSDPRFQSVQPWGNWGDGGNDGWIEEDGHYFQVYGPKATSSPDDSATQALAKAQKDFLKLPAKWKGVSWYSFVLNDRFLGAPAPLAAALQGLKQAQKLKSADTVCANHLLSRFMELSEEKRRDIIGYAPPPDSPILDTRALGELLSALADQSQPLQFLAKSAAPQFEEKIAFNGLTSSVADRLRVNSYQTSLVDDFLSKSEAGVPQAIAQEVRTYYEGSKIAIPDGSDEAANDRYVWILAKLIPPTLTPHPHSQAAYRLAAEIIMAKYFESCDVYEHPDSAATA
jgi:hypothetical protein